MRIFRGQECRVHSDIQTVRRNAENALPATWFIDVRECMRRVVTALNNLDMGKSVVNLSIHKHKFLNYFKFSDIKAATKTRFIGAIVS